MEAPESPLTAAPPAAPLFPLWVKVAGWIAGVALPQACFLLTIEGSPFGPYWQSGELNAYAGLILSARVAWPILPLLGLCILALGCLLANERMAARWYVRAGVYLGVPTTGLFAVAMGVYLTQAGSNLFYAIVGTLFLGVVAVAVPVLLIQLGRWLLAIQIRLMRRSATEGFSFLVLALSVAGLLLLAVCVFLSPKFLLFLPMLLAILSLLCAPFWSFGVFAYASWRLMRNRFGRGPRFTLAELLAFMGGLGVFLGSARLAAINALAEYARLPTSPPGGCYVATAAARGHGWLVGGGQPGLGGGRGWRKTPQLVRLKCGEIVLRALFPRLHRGLRGVYDRLGPRLAARLTNPWLADAAWLGLKPCEWLAVLLVWVATGEAKDWERRMDAEYRRGAPHDET